MVGPYQRSGRSSIRSGAPYARREHANQAKDSCRVGSRGPGRSVDGGGEVESRLHPAAPGFRVRGDRADTRRPTSSAASPPRRNRGSRPSASLQRAGSTPPGQVARPRQRPDRPMALEGPCGSGRARRLPQPAPTSVVIFDLSIERNGGEPVALRIPRRKLRGSQPLRSSASSTRGSPCDLRTPDPCCPGGTTL